MGAIWGSLDLCLAVFGEPNNGELEPASVISYFWSFQSFFIVKTISCILYHSEAHILAKFKSV